MKKYSLAAIAAMCSAVGNVHADDVIGPTGSVTVFQPPLKSVVVSAVNTPFLLGEWVLATDKVERVRYNNFALEFNFDTGGLSPQCSSLSAVNLYLRDGKHRRKIGSAVVSGDTVLINTPNKFVQPQNSIWKIEASTKFVGAFAQCAPAQLNVSLKSVDAYGVSSVIQLPVAIAPQISRSITRSDIAVSRIYSLSASPNFLSTPGNVSVSWASAAQSCTLNNQAVSANGSWSIYVEQTKSVTLTCNVNGRQESRTVAIVIGT